MAILLRSFSSSIYLLLMWWRQNIFFLHNSHIILNFLFHYFFQVPQSNLNYVMEKCSDTFVNVIRNLSLLTWKHLPMIASFLSRVQFFTQWAVQKHRSDFTHSTVSFRPPSEFHRGKQFIKVINMVIFEKDAKLSRFQQSPFQNSQVLKGCLLKSVKLHNWIWESICRCK